MNFEVIGKSHKEINAIKVKDKSVSLITIEKKSFYFTAEAVKVLKMVGEDKYVHLVRGKNERNEPNGYWYLVVNKDNTGFKITTSVSGGARINTIPGVRLFTQDTKRKIGDSFYLQKTDHQLNGVPVIEILVFKSVKKIGKE